MDARHWTDDDILTHIYVGEPAADQHLAACSECRAKIQAWQAKRDSVIEAPGVSHDFLAAQRRAIYRRLGEQQRDFLRLVPALAATSALLAGFLLYGPSLRKDPVAAPDDNSVFAEVYSLEQNPEPLAVQPMQALFQEN